MKPGALIVDAVKCLGKFLCFLIIVWCPLNTTVPSDAWRKGFIQKAGRSSGKQNLSVFKFVFVGYKRLNLALVSRGVILFYLSFQRTHYIYKQLSNICKIKCSLFRENNANRFMAISGIFDVYRRAYKNLAFVRIGFR